MYSYKLNNSYTVYVNHIYLNECIKATKEWKKHSSSYSGSQGIQKKKKRFIPLPPATRLLHKSFGFGRVLSTDGNGIMIVEFRDKIAKFVYPDAINQGFLKKA